MPNTYKRKATAVRGNWTEEALKAAISAVKNNGLSVRAAAKEFKIPRKTLERRIKKNDDKKGPMRPSSLFGEENEKKLAAHIKSMQSNTSSNMSNYTPSRILQEISPIPQKLIEVRRRAKQVGTLLTSEEHINARKCIAEKTLKKEIKKEKESKKCTVNKIKSIRKLSDSSDDVPLKILAEKTKKRKANEEDNCRGCGENYYETQLIEDWLQCKFCQFWVHEHCTEFDNSCSKCGQKEKKTKNYQNI